MGYSKEIYDKVQKELYDIKIEAVDELNRKKDILYNRFPEAAEIEKQLSATAIKAARAVISGANSKDELLKLRQTTKNLRERLTHILKSVNLPEDYLELNYRCKKCSDEGYVDGIMCDCMKKMMKKEVYNQLNKMSPLELSSFENFSLDFYSDTPQPNSELTPKKRMAKILEFCKKYASQFKKNSPSLLMTGSTGLGKTHLSLAIAKEVIEKGFGVIYGSAQNIISKMEKEKFRGYQNSSDETERHYIDCDLLIIDDLGTEYLTSFSVATIYNIINSRIMMNKPTIISTNLSMKDLEKIYSQRMVSRIIGNNIRLEFLGSDIRQRIMFQKSK
ncbi:MAG: ATP-binding protein [Clostridia bacterium]|nr:ATP-binding protein [Clostridia bacterium]